MTQGRLSPAPGFGTTRHKAHRVRVTLPSLAPQDSARTKRLIRGDTYVRVRILTLKSYLKKSDPKFKHPSSIPILIHLLSKIKPVGLIHLIGDIRQFIISRLARKKRLGSLKHLPRPMAGGPRARSPREEPNKPTHRYGGPPGSATHGTPRRVAPSSIAVGEGETKGRSRLFTPILILIHPVNLGLATVNRHYPFLPRLAAINNHPSPSPSSHQNPDHNLFPSIALFSRTFSKRSSSARWRWI